jgi:phosphoribosylglycinamide formyltransferase-1
MKNIAIFASGNGTNAEAIIRHFGKIDNMQVALVVSNRPNAYVLERAAKYNIPSQVLERARFYDGHTLTAILKEYQIDLIVLAGFLWLIPKFLIERFPDQIINIHPALLPKYGGKGMYGSNVHKAVKESGDTETGITIHMVNEQYDEGSIIFQARCPVDPSDSPESIANKVHELEYQYYPGIIESILKNQ